VGADPHMNTSAIHNTYNIGYNKQTVKYTVNVWELWPSVSDALIPTPFQLNTCSTLFPLLWALNLNDKYLHLLCVTRHVPMQL
jgi:hypothetical protein